MRQIGSQRAEKLANYARISARCSDHRTGSSERIKRWATIVADWAPVSIASTISGAKNARGSCFATELTFIPSRVASSVIVSELVPFAKSAARSIAIESQ